MADLQPWVTLGVAIFVESLFIHLAASLALGGAHYSRALLVAVLGSLAAGLVFVLVGGFPLAAFVLALVTWLAVMALLYRTSWLRALGIGILAYVLWVATRFLVGSVWSELRAA